MLEVLNDPPRLHAAVVHFPVVLAVLGVPLIIALIVTRGRSCTLRWLIVALYVAGALGGLAASWSGEQAVDRLSMLYDAGGSLTDAASEELEEHEEMGEKVWWMMLAPAVAVAITVAKRTPVRVVALLVALVFGVLVAGWVAVVGHHGGALVYTHGVGVPTSQNNLPAGQ